MITLSLLCILVFLLKSFSKNNYTKTKKQFEYIELPKRKSKEKNRFNKSHPLYVISFLAILGLICSMLLSVVNTVTSNVIKENAQKELEKTLENIKITKPGEVELEQYSENIIKIYTGIFNEKEECYVFEVSTKNKFTSFNVLVVIDADTRSILAIAPTTSNGLSTHGKDNELSNYDYNLIGSLESNYSTNFNSVSGATESSKSFIEAVKYAFNQLNELEGDAND